MKRIARYSLIIIAAALTACIGPQGPQGPQGEQGEPGISTQWEVINLTVPTDDWELVSSTDGTNPYYRAKFDVPELDDFIYDQGLTKCYIEFNRGTNNAYQQELPYVRHFEAYENDQQIIWTQTVDYDFGIGFVNVYVTFSDFFVDERPETMDFRLVLMW